MHLHPVSIEIERRAEVVSRTASQDKLQRVFGERVSAQARHTDRTDGGCSMSHPVDCVHVLEPSASRVPIERSTRPNAPSRPHTTYKSFVLFVVGVVVGSCATVAIVVLMRM